MSHHHTHIHHHHSIEARCEVMRRLEALDEKLTSFKETIMAKADDDLALLTGLLGTIGGEIDKVSADTDNLLTQLAAIPTSGIPQATADAIAAAVTMAQGISTRLQALDDKVPDAAAPSA